MLYLEQNVTVALNEAKDRADVTFADVTLRLTRDEVKRLQDGLVGAFLAMNRPKPAPSPPHPNDLATWFPILERTGVPVPATTILKTDVDLIRLCDGTKPEGFDGFLETVRGACDRHGYPCFLRTGQTSGKHEWQSSCYIEGSENLASHVANLVEYSALAGFFGLPTDTWVVRGFIPLVHTFTAFQGMPVAREFRLFIRGGNVECVHPCWPVDAIRNPSVPDWQERIDALNHLSDDEREHLASMARTVAAAFPGYWSVDFALGQDGTWYAIDMAQGEDSFHWAECEHRPAWQAKLAGPDNEDA